MNAKARRMMGNKAAVATVKAKADRHAVHVLPMVEEIWNAGTQTLGGIATAGDGLPAADRGSSRDEPVFASWGWSLSWR